MREAAGAGKRQRANGKQTTTGAGMAARSEVNMVAELNVISEWIPEQMGPGSMFVLENAGEMGEQEDPYWAVLACPSCATLGLITRRQIAGLLPIICGSDQCSAQFYLRDEEIRVRQAS